MYEQVEKTTEKKSQIEANGVSQRQNSHAPTFGFVDNRPEAIQMRKLRSLAKNSPQAKQIAQLQAMADNYSVRQQTIQKKENNTGLPDNLKSGIENLSGYSMDDVKVHRNSDKPAQLQAHAYAQGTDIHLGPGQEKHLPHEAWHVVQQKQGRVKPTKQLKSTVKINDDDGLEKEADVMGARALQFNEDAIVQKKLLQAGSTGGQVLQRVIRIKGEHGNIDITNMQELREVMKRPMSPYDDKGMVRAIFKDYILKESIMEFDSLEKMYDFGQDRLGALNERRDSITDEDLARSYGMSPATHPRSGKKIGYCLVPIHETRPELENVTAQEYFYRAMPRQEAMTWLNPPGVLLGDTGQPWASYAGYSRTYLNDTNTILVEIYAPGWLEKATSIGLLGGKPESRADGDMSFGTGEKSESSTGGTKDSNKRRNTEIKEEGLMPVQEGRKAVRRNDRSETLMLSSIYFRECAVSAKPIIILS